MLSLDYKVDVGTAEAQTRHGDIQLCRGLILS